MSESVSKYFRAWIVTITILLSVNPAFSSDSVTIRKNTDMTLNPFSAKGDELEITFDEKSLAPEDVRKIFNQLFSQYIAVRDALVYNDPHGAMQNTIELLDDMKSGTENVELLKSDDRWKFFLQNFESIKAKVKAANFISEQRFLFNEISSGIKDFIRQYGLYEKEIYIMECTPDSLNGKRIWFSDKRDKKNPYLGKSDDTTCTKVKEVWVFRKGNK